MKNEVSKECTESLVIEECKEPRLYQVNVHNDDFTPMEFVVWILEQFFYMERNKAINVMMEAHLKGKAGCGLFSKEVAETKVTQVIDHAKLHEHPLSFSMEAIL